MGTYRINYKQSGKCEKYNWETYRYEEIPCSQVPGYESASINGVIIPANSVLAEFREFKEKQAVSKGKANVKRSSHPTTYYVTTTDEEYQNVQDKFAESPQVIVLKEERPVVEDKERPPNKDAFEKEQYMGKGGYCTPCLKKGLVLTFIAIVLLLAIAAYQRAN
jgi:hypothetical protein